MLRNNDVDVVYSPFSSIKEQNGEVELFDIFSDLDEKEYSFNEAICSCSKKWIDMHAITYKTELIRESELSLPSKTLYTDTLYALVPMMRAETIYIMHENVYMYRIGRDEQSVSKNSRMRHYKEHENVALLAAKHFKLNKSALSKEKSNYFMEYVYILQKETVFNYILLIKNGKEALDCFLNQLEQTDCEIYDYLLSKKKELRKYVKNRNYSLLRLFSNKRIKKYVRLFSGR